MLNNMNKKTLKKLMITISVLGIFINISSAFAQTLEIEILGGGYKLRGPDQLTFSNISTGFTESVSMLNFFDLSTTTIDPVENPDGKGSLIIIDENGGSQYNVTVTASQLTYNVPGRGGPVFTIPKSSFRIKNTDDTHSSFDIINGSTDDFQLTTLNNTDTEGFAKFSTNDIDDVTVTLANGLGKAPGRYRIYPKLKIVIPSGQHPGTYTANLTFTIA